MTTANDLLEATRNHLLGGASEQLNILAANYTAGGTTLTLTYDTSNISAGKYVEVGTNLFYVWSVDQVNKILTVTGGMNGSTDANASLGAMVRVSPRFPAFRLFQELNNDIADLTSPANGLFQIGNYEFTYVAVKVGYDLPITGLLDILRIEYQVPGPTLAWPRFDKLAYRVVTNANTTDFPSGVSLKLFRGGVPGYTIRVYYKSALVPFTALTDNATVTGLPSSAYDLPPLGAALRLMAGREIKRNLTEAQPDTRRPTEVPPGAVEGSVRNLMLLRQTRIAAEKARLLALQKQFGAF